MSRVAACPLPLVALIWPAAARAQKDVLDNIVLLGGRGLMKSPGVETTENRPESKQPSALGEGRLEQPEFHRPYGAREEEQVFGLLESRTMERPFAGAMRTNPAGRANPTGRAAAPAAAPRGESARFGWMLWLGPDDPGPPHGLTLDAAIDRVARANADLRAKAHEISQADADLLTAGLRENPLLFWNAGGINYGSPSAPRPGTQSYPLVLVQDVDFTGRRRARQQVAREVKRVIEARYLDEVRRKIDDAQSAFVDALAARDAVRALRASLAEIDGLIAGGRPDDKRSRALGNKLRVERQLTGLALDDAEDRLRQAKRELVALLNFPAAAGETLQLHGTVRIEAPLPTSEQMVALALANRPDLQAVRLAVGRARAVEKMERSRRYRDTYLLYEPWSAEVAHTAQGRQTANTWGVGLFAPLPIFDRNQGNIERARLDVAKLSAETRMRERQVADEAARAADDCRGSREKLRRLENDVLPAVRGARDEAWRAYQSGEGSLDDYLGALGDYQSVVRHYRDALVRHRCQMLRLNTVAGRRIVP